MELHITARTVSVKPLTASLDSKGSCSTGDTYTKVFLRLIMLIIRMSIDREKPIMKILKFVSLLYFLRPFATRFYNNSGQ